MPAGLEVTEPVPDPFVLTSSVSLFKVKVAVTEWAASIVTMQVPVPEQPAPVQPVKSELASGLAVRVTTVPKAKSFVQVDPQSIPAGLEVTEPEPLPSVETSRVFGGFVSKVAVAECAASIVTTQSPVPEQPAPVHPVKSEPTSAVAVRVTTAPSPNAFEHVAP